CPHCGKGDIEYGAKACSECGSKILYKAISGLGLMATAVLSIVFAILAVVINFRIMNMLGTRGSEEELGMLLCCEGVLICFAIYCIVQHVVAYHKNFELQQNPIFKRNKKYFKK
ncbi:MAG: hypothetical protein IJ211_07615, partial [Campylobacter sp.]|nr:hypothetical protein [Campylobacter sp.]